MRALVPVFGILLASAQLASAQQRSTWFLPVQAGTGVRVTVDSAANVIRGSFRGMSGDSLRVELARGAAIAMPIGRVVYVDESQGRERWRWFWIGALAGAAAGGILGAWSMREEDELGRFVMTLAGITLGAPTGGIAGAVFAPERWTRHWNPERR